MAVSGKILVTGGCGFIGAHLCRRLVESDADVVVVDDLRLGQIENLGGDVAGSVDIRSLEIAAPEDLERVLSEARVERVIHLAAMHFIPACEANPVDAIRVNVAGTQALLSACMRAPSVEAVVVASSGAVYEPSEAPLRERDPLGPTDVYGHTKRWTEELAELFQRRTGIPVGIARIFNTFGPGETNPHFVPSVALQLLRGSRVAVGNLDSRRDYTFVTDVAAALTALVDACDTRPLLTCNIGRGEAVDGRRLVELLAELAGREPELVVEAERIRVDDRPVLLADPGLAGEELCWEPTVGLREGLEAVLERPLGARRGGPQSSPPTSLVRSRAAR